MSYTRILKKGRKTRVWTAVDRNEKRITVFEVGPGKASVLRKLEEELGMKADIKHVISKSETCLVESYNSVLRYYLARLHRKTKCYSNSILMLTLSVKLLLAYKYGLS